MALLSGDMMHFAQRNLHQDITYWGPGATNLYGQGASAAPILIKGRWEDKIQQVATPSGEEVTSSAEVFVDRDVAISGFLARGDHVDSPDPISDAREIQSYNTAPDLRNLGSERRAYL